MITACPMFHISKQSTQTNVATILSYILFDDLVDNDSA